MMFCNFFRGYKRSTRQVYRPPRDLDTVDPIDDQYTSFPKDDTQMWFRDAANARSAEWNLTQAIINPPIATTIIDVSGGGAGGGISKPQPRPDAQRNSPLPGTRSPANRPSLDAESYGFNIYHGKLTTDGQAGKTATSPVHAPGFGAAHKRLSGQTGEHAIATTPRQTGDDNTPRVRLSLDGHHQGQPQRFDTQLAHRGRQHGNHHDEAHRHVTHDEVGAGKGRSPRTSLQAQSHRLSREHEHKSVTRESDKRSEEWMYCLDQLESEYGEYGGGI